MRQHSNDSKAAVITAACLAVSLSCTTRSVHLNGLFGRMPHVVPHVVSHAVQEVKGMADRIITVRTTLKESLEALGSPHKWDHITEQIGMFCFSGMTPEQVRHECSQYAVHNRSSCAILVMTACHHDKNSWHQVCTFHLLRAIAKPTSAYANRECMQSLSVAYFLCGIGDLITVIPDMHLVKCKTLQAHLPSILSLEGHVHVTCCCSQASRMCSLQSC